jgi:hypothetical protein
MAGFVDSRTLRHAAVGRLRRGAVVLGAAALCTVSPTVRPSVAQVGYDPARSPFRDVTHEKGPFVTTGWLAGERGRVGVGHANGSTITAGFEFPITGNLNFFTSFTYALTDRYIVDPTKDDSVRKTGPFEDDMSILDIGVRFSLTGRKTWRNLAPYLRAAAGLATSRGSPVDSSGYRFGRKIAFSPGAGVRWYPSRRVIVVLDGRATLWRLRYPPDFHAIRSPDGIPVLAADQPRTDWTVHPWVSVGVGWTF